jgi:hypothetical protein
MNTEHKEKAVSILDNIIALAVGLKEHVTSGDIGDYSKGPAVVLCDDLERAEAEMDEINMTIEG